MRTPADSSGHDRTIDPLERRYGAIRLSAVAGAVASRHAASLKLTASRREGPEATD